MSGRKPTRAKGLGVTDAEYTLMLERQDGHCAICPATPKTRRLNVDHDHRSGAVRALLCHRCNRVLANWMTSAWLRAAADYLDHHSPPERLPSAQDSPAVPVLRAAVE